jgi:eukaryotic-like serine/threonine-protein kinase
MSVPNSVEELLQLIRKSGMVEDAKLNSYLHRRQAGRGLATDPREAADAMIADGLITNFQAEQFMLGKWRGFSVGKYKLLERVGVGGMGQVFLCEHMFMNRRVAVKVLPPSKAEQPAALGRFYREARAAGGLNHPNIVKTHDIDQDGNLHFIVMEYVDGSNLLDVVKKFGPMDIRRATHYIRQVALGLEYAFQNGIIHRDIKPGNFLIDREGTCKLLDMGLARFYQDQTDMLTIKYDDKIVLGTADYVAPEQVANSHEVDIRADLYALGASFYFLLAGHPPFPSGTVSQKLLWHRTKDPTPIRQVRPEVPEGLAAIVAKLMMKDPNQRYRTPAEVAAELERWVPAEVPAPKLEEMPSLSPAAETALNDLPKGGNSITASQLKKDIEELEPAGQAIDYGTMMKGDSARAGTATKTAPTKANTRPAFGNPFQPTEPNALMETPSPATANKHPSSMQVPVYQPKPVVHAAVPGSMPTTGGAGMNMPNVPSGMYGAFPVIAMPLQDNSGANRFRMVIGLVAVALVLSVGLFLYKFVLSKPKPQAAPVENTALTTDEGK